MTLDDAIKQHEITAKEIKSYVENGCLCDDTEIEDEYLERAEEHRQLAEWLKELKQLKEQTRWIPIKTRPLTEEEEEEFESIYTFMYDCPLPDDGQDVLITTCYGDVKIDTFCRDNEGCYFESYCDDGEVTAWMPLPQAYKAESEV